jgi:hypothetical protein
LNTSGLSPRILCSYVQELVVIGLMLLDIER